GALWTDLHHFFINLLKDSLTNLESKQDLFAWLSRPTSRRFVEKVFGITNPTHKIFVRNVVDGLFIMFHVEALEVQIWEITFSNDVPQEISSSSLKADTNVFSCV